MFHKVQKPNPQSCLAWAPKGVVISSLPNQHITIVHHQNWYRGCLPLLFDGGKVVKKDTIYMYHGDTRRFLQYDKNWKFTMKN